MCGNGSSPNAFSIPRATSRRTREYAENTQGPGRLFFGLVLGFAFMLIVGSAFTTLGGLLGALISGRKSAAPARAGRPAAARAAAAVVPPAPPPPSVNRTPASEPGATSTAAAQAGCGHAECHERSAQQPAT